MFTDTRSYFHQVWCGGTPLTSYDSTGVKAQATIPEARARAAPLIRVSGPPY